jgi:hypothetical protein
MATHMLTFTSSTATNHDAVNAACRCAPPTNVDFFIIARRRGVTERLRRGTSY